MHRVDTRITPKQKLEPSELVEAFQDGKALARGLPGLVTQDADDLALRLLPVGVRPRKRPSPRVRERHGPGATILPRYVLDVALAFEQLEVARQGRAVH